jgi:sortase A
MRDRRRVDELSIGELEEILRVRRREARLKHLRHAVAGVGESSVDPLAQQLTPGQQVLPTDHARFREVGDTADFWAQEVTVDATDPVVANPRPRISWKQVRDSVLLVVEVGLAVTLAYVLTRALGTLRDLDQESSPVSLLPTPTATPVIRVALLPGGHTPPDSVEGPLPAEVPAHLRSLVAAITPLPVPTPGPEHAVRIQVPTIGVDAQVVEGDDWAVLKRGAGHTVGTANPGERGNCVISAHNDIYGEIFRDLPDVALGDVAYVTTRSTTYEYVATQTRVIEPTEVSVMYPTSSPILTLISCYPYGIDTHRIAVVFELESHRQY